MDKKRTRTFAIAFITVAVALSGCATRRIAALEGRVFKAEVAIATKADSAAVVAEFEKAAAAIARGDAAVAAERRERETAVTSLAGKLAGETAARETAVAELAGRQTGFYAGVAAAVRAVLPPPTVAPAATTPVTAAPAAAPAPKAALVTTARPAVPAASDGFDRWRAERAIETLRAQYAPMATRWIVLPGFEPGGVDTAMAARRNPATARLLDEAVAAQTTKIVLVVGLTTPDEERACQGVSNPLCSNLGGSRAAHAKRHFSLPPTSQVGSVVSEEFGDRGRGVIFFFAKK